MFTIILRALIVGFAADSFWVQITSFTVARFRFLEGIV